jgi:hypothetical protein
MNVVDPINQLYSRKTQIPPYMYPLARWDLNLDGRVDMADVNIVAKAMGSRPGDAKWNLEADVDCDGAVSQTDLVEVATNFGKTAPQWPLPKGSLYHDVAVTDLTSAKSVVGQGFVGNLMVTAQNQGYFTENFEVTVYANTTIINTLNFNLAIGGGAAQEFVWNTTGFAYGNYTLTAAADVVVGETNTANNNCTDGWLVVTIPGDLNGDFNISLADLVLLANAYGSMPGDTKWNANADINGDLKVSLADLVLMANHYGQHYP